MHCLPIVMASMMAFNVIHAQTALIQPKKIRKECVKRQKTRSSDCVYDYSEVMIGESFVKKLFSAIKKQDNIKSVIRLSNSGVDNKMARRLSKFITSGVNVRRLELPFGNMGCSAIEDLLIAADSNNNVEIVNLDFNTFDPEGYYDCFKNVISKRLRRMRSDLAVSIKPGKPFTHIGRGFSVKYQNATLGIDDDAIFITRKNNIN